jgi:hypothetical protein
MRKLLLANVSRCAFVLPWAHDSLVSHAWSFQLYGKRLSAFQGALTAISWLIMPCEHMRALIYLLTCWHCCTHGFTLPCSQLVQVRLHHEDLPDFYCPSRDVLKSNIEKVLTAIGATGRRDYMVLWL